MRFERAIYLVKKLFFNKNEQKLKNIDHLCQRINYTFRDQTILFQSLKHRSFLTTSGEPRITSNERLELLGDAVLGLVVTEYLYKDYPKEEEGGLTTLKSLLVSRKSLSTIAREFGLGEYLLLSDAEANAGGRNRSSILADAVEAIIGAIYLDGGLEQASQFIHMHIIDHLEDFLAQGIMKNYKSILLEYCQGACLSGPNYVVKDEKGPDHDKTFIIAVHVNGDNVGLGQGHTKKLAEQRAAKEALLAMNLLD